MPAAARPAARSLALVAGAIVVVLGLAVWWTSSLRALNESEPRRPTESGEVDVEALRSQLRSLEGALTRLAKETTESADTSGTSEEAHDPSKEASADHLSALVRAFEAAPEGKDRDRILDRFTYAHSMYAEMSGDLRFLPFLRTVIETSPSAEQRKYAVIALHGVGSAKVVDFVQELLSSPHPEVRFYAAEALPWVAGPERDRAQRLLAGALENEDPEVRRIVALSLGVVIADPVHVGAMLRRLAVETSDQVLEALVFGVKRILPTEGGDRIRAVARDLDRSRADRIEGLLRSRP